LPSGYLVVVFFYRPLGQPGEGAGFCLGVIAFLLRHGRMVLILFVCSGWYLFRGGPLFFLLVCLALLVRLNDISPNFKTKANIDNGPNPIGSESLIPLDPLVIQGCSAS
jgi:hypothetical protein